MCGCYMHETGTKLRFVDIFTCILLILIDKWPIFAGNNTVNVRQHAGFFDTGRFFSNVTLVYVCDVKRVFSFTFNVQALSVHVIGQGDLFRSKFCVDFN